MTTPKRTKTTPEIKPRQSTIKQFARKSKEAMSKPNARWETIKGYHITSHAQNQMVGRDIPPTDLIQTLKKAQAKGPVTKKEDGYSFEQHGKKVTVCIEPKTNNVKTTYALDPYDARKYHFKYEPLSNQRKNDPDVQKRIKHSLPKNEKTTVSYKSTITKTRNEISRKNGRR